MSKTVLKLAPREDGAETSTKRSGPRISRARLRMILLVAVPAIAFAIGLGIYFMSGRYISTDNAYVGAQKVLITPDVSGQITKVLVHEGQHVKAGDPLFDIDPVPFDLALRQAKSKLNDVRTTFANLKSNYASLSKLVALAEKEADIKKRDVERKQELAAHHTGTEVAVDEARAAMVTAELQLQYGRQQQDSTLNQLLGDPDLALEDFPAYQQAKAALDEAERNVDHAVVKAPISGTATQVDSIQLGRFVTAGTPVFSVIDDSAPWVDANPKETDITYLRVGEKVDIEVDSFSDRVLHGTVTSVSPGTGAQFAILPPQNASGNWVKVVQRVPVRIAFDPGQDLTRLRAGMSVTVDIDTGRYRNIPSLFSSETADAAEAQP